MKKAITVTLIVLVLGGGFILLKNQQTPQSPQESTPQTSQEGKILAGKSAPYIVFSKEEYEKALNSDKIIFLDFYANWCPICRGEEPKLKAGFDSLITDKVIGFRVNWEDSDTDEDEKKLAEKFGVMYQMTKVILKGDTVLFGPRSEVWDKETFLKNINQFIQ